MFFHSAIHIISIILQTVCYTVGASILRSAVSKIYREVVLLSIKRRDIKVCILERGSTFFNLFYSSTHYINNIFVH